MSRQEPTTDRPRPNNVAPPAREDAEYEHTCPDCERCRYDGYRIGRSRGFIDAWYKYTGNSPDPDLVLASWVDVWQTIRRLVGRWFT